MSETYTLSQAQLDKEYMRGVLDMEHAIDAWFRSEVEPGDASDALYNSLMKAMHDGCRMSEEQLAAMRSLANVASTDAGGPTS